MSTPSTRSPCAASTACQSPSPRLSSPIPSSLSSFNPAGHGPGNSPVNEMSDTLSPLRDHLEPGLTISPRASPSTSRPRASSFSRSPERSPIIPLQPHRAYTRHSSPSSSPFVQGIPFPCSSPLSLSPLVGRSQSPVLQNQRSLSPSNSSRPGSPASIHSTYSQFRMRPLRSPQVSAAQNISPRYTRTQSLIQQSFGTPHAGHAAASLADNTRSRRVSLGAGIHPHQSAWESPKAVDNSPIQGMVSTDKGSSTPLNEAPIRWWGGRAGWVDDWGIALQQSHGTCDAYTNPSSGQLNGTIGMEFVQPECGSPSTFREPFGRGGGVPSVSLNEEIRASFDPLSSGPGHVPVDVNTGYGMHGVPISHALPRPMISGSAWSISEDCRGYGEVVVGPPAADRGFSVQKTIDERTRCHSCHVHSHGHAGEGNPDGAMSQEHELRYTGRSRRFSDASTHSSMSYVSCLSGQSQSQSHSLLMSQSHASTFPSLSSLGIGIEEAEREELRSRSIWRRRNSGSTMKRHGRGLSNSTNGHDEEVGPGCRCSQSACKEVPEGVCENDVKGHDAAERTGADSKQSVTQTQDKDVVRHKFIFSRVSARQGDVSDQQAQHEGYTTAEKYVSLAVTSILSPATIAHLSLFGEALVKARNSAKYVGHELGPLFKDTLSVSTEVLSLAPLPGLEEAAKALLCVWDACQKVDTNRLACLRLAERCATLLYTVRCEIDEAGLETALGLAEPVEKLCGALVQIRSFLETQLHRPFLKRYVRREEIARELQACNEAITNAGSRFGLSVQIRTYQEVVSMMKESKRWFAQEAQALVLLDHQMTQRHLAMMYGSQVSGQQVPGFSVGNALGLLADGKAMDEGCNHDRGGCLSPPPVHGPSPSIMRGVMSADVADISGHPTPTSSMLPIVPSSASAVLAIPTPTRATFVMEGTETKAPMTMPSTHPTCPMQALAQVHRAQDAIDAAADEAALRGTLTGALDAQSDVEMVRCLQVGRGEISEAAETLRRTLGTAAEGSDDGNKRATLGYRTQGENKGHTELDRKFMQSGIDAMTRLTKAAANQSRGSEGRMEHKDAPPAAAQELPTWTITRYEVIRTRKIGLGFFSHVYLGHWRKLDVVIKVLAHSVSRESFVSYVESWNRLDHPNVLPLYGASSATGEKPWFFVSKFCSGGNLVESLKRIGMDGTRTAGNEMQNLLKHMYEIAKGMAYLHERGILHGDLRAANVLVDENGQSVVSDFAQCGIKSEAHQSCGQPALRPLLWTAPEVLMGTDQQTCATDMYAFAMCCVEILAMGEVPWRTLDYKTICELVLDKDERPTIPVPAGCAEITSAVMSLIQSCWVREPDHRPTFASVASSLEEIWRPCQRSNSPVRLPSTPVANIKPASITPTGSSPGEEQYETASESMMTEVEERVDCMIDVPLTSPVAVLGHPEVAHSVTHIDTNDHTEVMKLSGRESSGFTERRDTDTPMAPLTNRPDVNMMYEVNYRLIMGSNHSFHSSLTLPLWSPTHVELGAVGYLSRPKGEFITLFNAMDPMQSCEERLRQLPSMYGYGKVEVHKREDGKRGVAQRGLDAISGFLTFKTRNDRLHPERIARQYTFPLTQGMPCANLCVEKTVHRYMDHLEVPEMWFKQHADLIFKVLSSRHAILKEDLILVVGTLDAPDWAIFVSDDHSDGRVQFSVFSGRERGEPWGMYTMEQPSKGVTRLVDVKHGSLASKVSCVMPGNHDVVGDTVMLAGLHFEPGQETPTTV